MKRIAYVLVGVGVIFTSGCVNSPISLDEFATTIPGDTLGLQATSGVTLGLSGLQDTYSLQDTISWNLVLKNVSDVVPFPLYFTGAPPFRMLIYQEGVTDPIYYAPIAIGYAEWADTLRIGDSLNYPGRWLQNTYDSKHTVWTTLRDYPGLYRFEIWLGGNSKLKGTLVKYFRILERGNPLSAWLRIDYSSTDTVKADFIVRNRARNSVQLEASVPQAMTIDFLRSSKIALTITSPLPANVGKIEGASELVAFPFRALRTDSAFTPLKGVYDMKFTLHLKSGDLSDSGLRYLP